MHSEHWEQILRKINIVSNLCNYYYFKKMYDVGS